MIAADQISVIIAHGDEAVRTYLYDLLRSNPLIRVIGCYADGADALKNTLLRHPDIIMVDADLPVVDGPTLARHAGPEVAPVVALLANDARHAAAAFELGATDFLVAPFSERRVMHSLERCRAEATRRRILETGFPASPGADPSRAAPHGDSNAGQGKILVKHQGRMIVLRLDSVVWVEAAANYQRLHTTTRSYMVRMTLGEMQQLLDPNLFARIHRTTIVNTEHVTWLRNIGSGSYLVGLSSGVELRMSRTYGRQFLAQHYSLTTRDAGSEMRRERYG